MRIIRTAIAALIVTVSSSSKISFPEDGILVNSKVGKHVMESARRLDGDNDQGAVDFSFVSEYAIKFQGYHHIS